MNALSDFLQLWTKLNLAKSYTFNNFADSGSKDKRKRREIAFDDFIDSTPEKDEPTIEIL